MNLILWSILCIPFICNAQDLQNNNTREGIQFEKGVSWEEVKAKAKLENKFIFMDCYATWCGPCKFMDQRIFPQKEVGDYFNAHFISVAVQMDQTEADPKNVKQWYYDAKTIEKEYAISSFPTYLFFSPNGIAVHRVVGSTGIEAKNLIDKANDALLPDKQYFTLISGYKDHTGDSIFLRSALITALDARDKPNASKIGAYYLDCLKNPYTKDNLTLLQQAMTSSSDKVFQFLLNNSIKIDSVLGKDAIEIDLIRMIYLEEIDPLFTSHDTPLNWKSISTGLTIKYPSLGDNLIKSSEDRFRSYVSRNIAIYIHRKDDQQPNWVSISSRLKKQLPGYDFNQIIAEQMVEFYASKKQWHECEKAAYLLMNQYGNKLSHRRINNIAWNYVFLHSTSQKVLFKALKLVETTIANYPHTDYANIDTYANLLYKLGDKKNAIFWEKRAIENLELIKSNTDLESLKEFKRSLQKMQRGEKTWEGRNGHGDYL